MKHSHMIKMHRSSDMKLLSAKRTDEAGAVSCKPEFSNFHGRQAIEDKSDTSTDLICKTLHEEME